jgi:hypothetical protein
LLLIVEEGIRVFNLDYYYYYYICICIAHFPYYRSNDAWVLGTESQIVKLKIMH